MKTKLGIWIDHNRAILVFLRHKKSDITEIESHAKKMPRQVNGKTNTAAYEPLRVGIDNIAERQFAEHLKNYYDRIISCLLEVEGGLNPILIMGPGEAKTEFHKRLEEKSPQTPVATIETVDKMLPHQVELKTKEFFKS